jgi:hypothetical protein
VSVEAEAWAWKQRVSSTEKIVLVRLANRSDEHGVCWPGQKGIAEDCSLSRETVNRAIKHLVELKKLEIIPRHDGLGRPMSNYYQLRVNEGGNVTDDHRGSDPASQGIVTDDHTNSHIEQSVEQKDKTDDSISVQELVESWNDLCPPVGLAAVRELSPTRKQKAGARIREHPKVGFWNDVFHNLRRSDFLLGKVNRNGHDPWRANFDWLIDNDTNCIKVAEGRYAKSER